MLIQNAQVRDPADILVFADVRIRDGKVHAVGRLTPASNENLVNADGGLLIPGLNDHHAHLVSYAASLNSIDCGPPQVTNEKELAEAINQPGTGWIRGTGFHESVYQNLDRNWLDENGPDRPIRIQHRSGRLWILNSVAMAEVEDMAMGLPAHERSRLSSQSGRLYDVDELLSSLTRSSEPPVKQASLRLAKFGVTGINDMTPSNDQDSWQWFKALQRRGDLLQRARMSGRSELSECQKLQSMTVGESKVHLHDTSLPDFGDFVELIVSSHKKSRGVAVHCVTQVELVFTLSAFRAAGTIKGDRVEHASVVPPLLIEQLADLELGIVTQPNFVTERGDAYLRDIPDGEHPHLYRVKSLLDRNVPVAFGTDLPFGNPDPWRAMLAATQRKTHEGHTLGEEECVSPEQALQGFLGSLEDPFTPRSIEPGTSADLCLLDAPWDNVRSSLSSKHVRRTFSGGQLTYSQDANR